MKIPEGYGYSLFEELDGKSSAGYIMDKWKNESYYYKYKSNTCTDPSGCSQYIQVI